MTEPLFTKFACSLNVALFYFSHVPSSLSHFVPSVLLKSGLQYLDSTDSDEYN